MAAMCVDWAYATPPASVMGRALAANWRRSRFKLEMGVFGGMMEDYLLHLSPKRKLHKHLHACGVFSCYGNRSASTH